MYVYGLLKFWYMEFLFSYGHFYIIDIYAS